MATTAASYRNRQPSPTLVSTVHSYRQPVRFDAAFLERRMREHKQWQEEQAAADAAEIISEVAVALDHVVKVRAQRAKRLA